MATVQASIDLALDPSAAFDLLVEELVSALRRAGIHFEAGPDGRIDDIGQITTWAPGDRIGLTMQSTEVELRFEPAGDGTKVVVELQGWGESFSGPDEQGGWFAGEVVARLLRATEPDALGDWLTDRMARRPSGAQARAVYRDPLYHYPNFRVILKELELGPDDYLLEVGCGGGALLKTALLTGCRAAAVDHSPDMVLLAKEANRDAVSEGRLQVVDADAASLPFPDGTFTCATMTGVLGFLPDPVAALAEIHRVLVDRGRFVAMGSDPELRGTHAAPEPFASRLRFYDDAGLEELGRKAGFAEVRVVHRNLESYAREAGVPEEHIPLFGGYETRFLLGRRS